MDKFLEIVKKYVVNVLYGEEHILIFSSYHEMLMKLIIDYIQHLYKINEKGLKFIKYFGNGYGDIYLDEEPSYTSKNLIYLELEHSWELSNLYKLIKEKDFDCNDYETPDTIFCKDCGKFLGNYIIDGTCEEYLNLEIKQDPKVLYIHLEDYILDEIYDNIKIELDFFKFMNQPFYKLLFIVETLICIKKYKKSLISHVSKDVLKLIILTLLQEDSVFFLGRYLTFSDIVL